MSHVKNITDEFNIIRICGFHNMISQNAGHRKTEFNQFLLLLVCISQNSLEEQPTGLKNHIYIYIILYNLLS